MDGRAATRIKIRGLETGQLVIQVGKAGWNSRDGTFVSGGLLDLLQRCQGNLPDRRKISTAPILQKIKNPFLGILQDHLQRLIAAIAGICDLLV